MKKRIVTLLATMTAFVCLFSGAAYALAPGASDYSETTEVRLDQVAGDKIEMTSVDSGIVVSIDKTALPAGVTSVKFEAREITAQTDSNFNSAVAAATTSGFSNVTVFDFSLKDTGSNSAITQLNGKISITVACPAGTNTVLYFDETTGTIANLGGSVSGDGKFITFETDHFSYYALATVGSAPVTLPSGTTDAGVSQNPQTGDSTPITLIATLVIGAAGLLFAGKKAFAK